MIKGFRDFILRGNVVDLAVAVVIGAAFTQVVDSFVDGFISPLIAAIFGEPNLDNVLAFTVNNAQFSIGLVLTAAINFLLVAAVIYFVVVLPSNMLRAKFVKAEEEAGPTVEEQQLALLKEIRDELRQRD